MEATAHGRMRHLSKARMGISMEQRPSEERRGTTARYTRSHPPARSRRYTNLTTHTAQMLLHPWFRESMAISMEQRPSEERRGTTARYTRSHPPARSRRYTNLTTHTAQMLLHPWFR